MFGQSTRNTGVYGKSLLAGQYGVYASGNLGASGTKTFVEPHPYDASKQIHYAALEGPKRGLIFGELARSLRASRRLASQKISASSPPKAALKANGTLNEDGSINVGTAEQLGWAKKESWTRSKEKESDR